MSLPWDGGRFADLAASRMPAGLALPGPLALLFDWCQEQGFVRCNERRPDEPYAALRRDDAWVGPGSAIAFQVPAPEEALGTLLAWFNTDDMHLPHPLVPIAETGADGSSAALWVDGAGTTRVVQLGSGSGSTLCTTMGADCTDFLRFLGIGYEEICWQEEWTAPPDPAARHGPVRNEPYLAWLASFGLAPPATGSEIVPTPGDLLDDDSPDDFWRAVFLH